MQEVEIKEAIFKLRKATGKGLLDCKQLLIKNNYDYLKTLEELKVLNKYKLYSSNY